MDKSFEQFFQENIDTATAFVKSPADTRDTYAPGDSRVPYPAFKKKKKKGKKKEPLIQRRPLQAGGL